MYSSVKQKDNTYTIYYSRFGLNKEIVMTGVRGCNVNRVINKLYYQDFLNVSDRKK